MELQELIKTLNHHLTVEGWNQDLADARDLIEKVAN